MPKIAIFARSAMILLSLALLMGLASGIDVGLSITQPGSPREPFDVGRSVTYDVLLSSATHSMRYDVELTVGPDIADSSVSKTFTSAANLAQGGSTAAQFQVNFQAPEMRRGDYGRWLSDKNQTGLWEGAWYSLKVSSLDPFEKPVTLEDYTGHPTLVKLVEEFKGHEVSPKTGTNRDSFQYQVSVFSTTKDNITLELASSPGGPWAPSGVREYTTPGSWQTLRWDNVTLGFDFTSAYYRFTGRKQSQAYSGPFWPVVVEFKNNSLSPQRGLSSTPFAYSIMVNASKKIDVGLNVLDIATKSFQTVGRTSYDNVSRWETFVWEDIRPTSQIDLTGSSNYYYSFYYPGAETPFNTTYEMLGKYFPGPDLVLVELYNQTVTPINGTAFTPYTYSVEVKTARPRADIELQTSPPGSVIWSGRGTVTYDGSNDTLVWKNVTFSESVQSVGDGRYRFVLDDVVLGAFLGPNLDIAFKDATYERIGQTDRFDYKVKVRSSSPRLTLELVYSDDGVTWVHSKLYQVYESSSQEWKELVWKNQPWHQTVRFDEVRR